jgi:hypothetical protein
LALTSNSAGRPVKPGKQGDAAWLSELLQAAVFAGAWLIYRKENQLPVLPEDGGYLARKSFLRRYQHEMMRIRAHNKALAG